MAVPFAPELNIRPLQPEQHLAHAGALVNHMLQRAPYSAPLTDALMHGSLRRYRSIPGETVARAIVALAAADGSGVQIHENDAIRALAD